MRALKASALHDRSVQVDDLRRGRQAVHGGRTEVIPVVGLEATPVNARDSDDIGHAFHATALACSVEGFSPSAAHSAVTTRTNCTGKNIFS